jgi:two-component system, LytTR family, response regulator
MKLRAFIIEDEIPARQRLRTMLAAEPQVELAGLCDGSPDTPAHLREAAPNVVFLDLHLGRTDGFALLDEAALAPSPAIVVVTAHAGHAVEAFDRRVTDYLLKPYRASRLRAALDRVRGQLTDRGAAGERAEPGRLVRFVVRNERHLEVVPVSEVEWLGAAGNYVVLHAGRATHILRDSLSALETRLDSAQFVRISRSAIVNVNRIRGITTEDSGESTVTLSCGERLPYTRGLRELQALLETG